MIKKKLEGNKRLSIDIRASLHDMLRRFAADQGTSQRDIIEKYLEYLFAQGYLKRRPLNEKSKKVDLDFDP